MAWEQRTGTHAGLLRSDLALSPRSHWLFAARFCLAAVFLYSGVTKLVFWSTGIEEFAGFGIPAPALALAATIVVQLAVAPPLHLAGEARWRPLRWPPSLSRQRLSAIPCGRSKERHSTAS